VIPSPQDGRTHQDQDLVSSNEPANTGPTAIPNVYKREPKYHTTDLDWPETRSRACVLQTRMPPAPSPVNARPHRIDCKVDVGESIMALRHVMAPPNTV
jgi:hypothetical protein